MADRVVLHIGTMKSGTTYLQDVLGRGGAEPGGYLVGGSFGVQSVAVTGMLGQARSLRPAGWQALVEEARGRDGVAVVSHEFLSFVRRARAAELVDSFAGTPVDVVLTVRDQHRALPAQWQSFVRNRGLEDWPGYLRALTVAEDGPAPGGTAEAPDPVRTFRRAQDVPRILRRWTGHAGVASVTAVAVPPPGADTAELWRRFRDAAALDAGAAPGAGERANESLGYASCDVLRRLNHHLTPLATKRYQQARGAVLPALLPLRAGEGRPVLTASAAGLAGRLNERILAALAEHGVRLVGDASELPGADAGAPADPPPPPEPGQVRRALREAWGQNVADVGPPDADCDEISGELGRRLVDRFA